MKTPTDKQIENARQTIIQHGYGTRRWAQDLELSVVIDLAWQSMLLSMTGNRAERNEICDARTRIKLLRAVAILEAAQLPSYEKHLG
jgi:hypothetical protein